MGLAKRLRKKYSRPLKIWDKEKIAIDKDLMKRYGLKNKKEIWRAESLLRKIRERARELIALRATGKGEEETKKFIQKLNRQGILNKENAEIDDILELSIEDILKRRITSIIFYNLNKAKSIKEARQLVVHNHVYIGERIINSPSYLVPKEEEKMINIDKPTTIKNGEQSA
ncbi:MAG: 30S ribosomal protein S4 [Candidatus Rehaiarchaeum fermentans]|nr:30S ribosomal protein S4 [Candidatus Rehaiarchaeum fermentans]MCW1297350.1 30S ribosomal protein S4 [Candidatus Rehaiarchaeum fermentans]MCW1302149.1 30S ribosomal protein S4 [Candidatus Rehaiarchaeum fermentans]